MLGKWVTNRWARFRCLAYCQYIFMLYSLLSPFVTRRSFVRLFVRRCLFSLVSWGRALIRSLFLSVFFFYSLFSLHILLFSVFIILLFNFLLLGALALQPLIPMVLLMSYMLLFRFVSLSAFRVSPKSRSSNRSGQWQKRAKMKIRLHKKSNNNKICTDRETRERERETASEYREWRDEQKTKDFMCALTKWE